MYIIIPAYEPDEKMIGVIQNINETLKEAKVVIVDDGSGKEYAALFHIAQKKGATVLTHEVNRGKGAALKTAFTYIQSLNGAPDTMVTIDCDGQHLVEDMIRVVEQSQKEDKALVLGVRAFSGKVPVRSKLGNRITALLFRLATGTALSDTQTGLRAMSTDLIDWLLRLEGDRFEYEFNMLLEAHRNDVNLVQVPIETVYIEENKSSHFRPLQDSLRIYAPFLKFLSTAGLAAAVDFIALIVLMFMTNHLLLSVVVARLISASIQCVLNAKVVFHQTNHPIQTAMKYFVLMLVMLLGNYMMLNSLLSFGVGIVIAKLVTEGLLFLVSYHMQRNFVYA